MEISALSDFISGGKEQGINQVSGSYNNDTEYESVMQTK